MFFRGLNIILIVLILFSCENEIDVIDEVESKPVIYSLLNLHDTVYSVSLTRTFIEEENAYLLAKNPGAVFYPSANIRLDGLVGDSSIWSTSFYKTDVRKDEGIFPSEPGYLYYSDSVITDFDENGLLGGYIETFRLSIHIPSHNISASAKRPYCLPGGIASPLDGRTVSLFDRKEFTIICGSIEGYRQLSFRVRYIEKLKDIEEPIEQEIEYMVRKNMPSDKYVLIPGDFFLNKLARNIPLVDNLQFRRFIDFDIIFFSTDEAFLTYITTNTYTNDMIRPDWSNIENGIGIFSLISIDEKSRLKLDQRSRDSIAFSPITSKLKFVNW